MTTSPSEIDLCASEIVSTHDSLKGAAIDQFGRDEGCLLPEVVLDKSSARFILLDGHHRIAGVVKCGVDTFRVKLVGTTERSTVFSGKRSDMLAEWHESFPEQSGKRVLDVVVGEHVGQVNHVSFR